MSVTSRVKTLARWRPAALDVLRQQDYRNFWLSNAFADLTIDLRSTAMRWLVLQLTNSPLWIGVVGGIGGLPAIILGLFGGALADRFDKYRILLITRSIMGILAFITAYLVTSGVVQPWHLLILAIGFSSALAFSNPAWRAKVADLVDRKHLLSANSLAALAGNLGEILGPALAGFIIASYGVDKVFYIVGVLYFLSLVLMFRVRTRSLPRAANDNSLLGDVKDGLTYSLRTPPIPAVLLLAFTILFAVAIFPLMPIYARDVLNVGATGFGILGGALGAGFLVGSLITSLSGDFRKKGLALIIFGALWDYPMAAFAFSETFWLSVAIVFVMGIGGAVWTNLTITILQTLATDEMRGRVVSLYTISLQVSPLGMMLGGALAETVNTQFPLLLGAIISTPMGIVVYALSPKLRQI